MNKIFVLFGKTIKSLKSDGIKITILKIKNKLQNRNSQLDFTNWVKKQSLEQYYNILGENKSYLPFVSIIVPNYNHARYLEKRINSILTQTYQNFELLLLDDCSTDKSREILQNYASMNPEKVKCIFNKNNAGNVFKQWKKGIENSCGELIWICESDDFCESDFLGKIVENFRNPAVNIAFGRIQFCGSNGEFLKGLDNYREGAESGVWQNRLIRPANKWFCNGFGVNNVIANVGGCVFKKQFFEPEVWEEAQKYKILGDWYLYSQIANGGLIAYEPSAIAYFRQHDSNTSVSSFSTAKYYKEHYTLMKTLKEMWDIHEKTLDKFYSKIEFQYKHFECEKNLGKLENYVNKENLKNIPCNKKHILVAMLAFHPGGGELFPINLANELQRQGNIVSLFVYDMSNINKEMYNLVDKRIAIYDSRFVEAYGVKEFLNEAGISLINSHMVVLDVFFLIKHKINIKYFCTLHGSYEACNVPQNEIKEISKGVTHWIYTTDRNLNALRFLNLPEKKFSKLQNAMPVDSDIFPQSRKELGIDDDTIVFTLVARGIKRKGWRAAIQAFIKLEKIYPNVHLLLCGDGEETQNYKEQYKEFKKITFLGYQSKIHGLYRISNCAIVPTRFAGESYPLCIIQALQVGLPVISTEVGEIKSMLDRDNEIAGIILPSIRNTDVFIEHLFNAMNEMLKEEKRIKFSQIAYNIGTTYRMDNLAKKYMEVFEKSNDKKRIYLHIGIGKTGTSSIQKMLLDNYYEFLEQAILVPKSGIKYGMAHHGLANLEEDIFSLETEEIYNSLIDEIDASFADNIIISSELFSYVKPSYIEQVHKYLKKYDVKIIFYVREQVKLFESTYLQWLKVGNKNLNDPESFFEGHKNAWDFNNVISPWEKYFGEENIKVRLFDKKINKGNVCKDFMKFINLEALKVKYPTSFDNESLIPEFKDLVIKLDKLDLSAEQRKEIIKLLVELSKNIKSLSSEKLIADEKFYNNLINYYKNSNNLITHKYLSDEEKEIFYNKI
jgi:glycosyltransferase involved in cell wall biosynthesis